LSTLTEEFQIVEGLKHFIYRRLNASTPQLLNASTKNPNRFFRSGFLDFYPTGAVQVILPFPFSKGRMTVDAEADFQRRRAISRTNQASFVHQLSVRGRHLNREHRRVNSKAAG
jgi:hypothetical protein